MKPKHQPHHPAPPPLTKPELNTLILHFLRETGMIHSSFAFETEASAKWNPKLTVGRLQSLLEKGRIMEQLEHESLLAFKRENKDALAFSKKKTRTRQNAKDDAKKVEVLNLKKFVTAQIKHELQNIKKKAKKKPLSSKDTASEKRVASSVNPLIPSKHNQLNLTGGLSFQSADLKNFVSAPLVWSQEFLNNEQAKSKDSASLKDIGIHLQQNALGNNPKESQFPVPLLTLNQEERGVVVRRKERQRATSILDSSVNVGVGGVEHGGAGNKVYWVLFEY